MNVGPGLPTRPPTLPRDAILVPAYSLLVAGAPSAGKSSLLRLILDTAHISPHATSSQLDSVARLVRHIQYPSAEPRFVECQVEVLWAGERVLLRLIDTPGLDFAAQTEDDIERGLRDILHLVEDRYIEGARDESTVGESHVHLCLYVLDPANIVPRPPYGYRRTSSASSSDSYSPTHPYSPHLPYTTTPNGTPYPPSVPPAEIAAIRRLSSRVNVLPVLGRCDAVTVDRLTEVKIAVRRDLADAGLGFGIFDEEGEAGVAPTALLHQEPKLSSSLASPNASSPREHATAGAGGSSHSPMDVKPPPPPAGTEVKSESDTASHPAPPAMQTVPLLPYALFCPESPRKMGKRELVGMYTAAAGGAQDGGSADAATAPTSAASASAAADSTDAERLAALRGKFVRRYRWGVLDVLDVRHSDFVNLRKAVMGHRKVLKTYTKDYLYEKFKVDSLLAAQAHPNVAVAAAAAAAAAGTIPPPPPQPQPQSQQPRHSLPPVYRHQHVLPPIVHTSPPMHAAHPGSVHALLNHAHHPVVREDARAVVERERERDERERDERERDIIRERERVGVREEEAQVQQQQPQQPPPPSIVENLATMNGRKRKITMACNFCRSRKLKCDGLRPTCAQCDKRGNTCDYQPHAHPSTQQQPWKYKARRDTLDAAHPPPSARPHDEVDELDEEGGSSDDARTVYDGAGRKRVSVDMLIAETLGDGSAPAAVPPTAQVSVPVPAPVPPPPQVTTVKVAPPPYPLGYEGYHHHHAAPGEWYAETEGGAGMGVIDVGSEGDKKKRLNRQSANYGSKAVACVHCRARKTRCDAARPACGNCARRSLTCSYVHTQPSQPRSKGKKAAAAAKEEALRQQHQQQSSGPGATTTTLATQESTPHLHPVPHWANATTNGVTSNGTTTAPPHTHSTSHSNTHSPSRSPIPAESTIEESAERERPRSPAPPIATLPPAPNGYSGNATPATTRTRTTSPSYVNGVVSKQQQQHEEARRPTPVPPARTPERVHTETEAHSRSRSRESSVADVAVHIGEKRKSPDAGPIGSDDEHHQHQHQHQQRPEKRRKWQEEMVAAAATASA